MGPCNGLLLSQRARHFAARCDADSAAARDLLRTITTVASDYRRFTLALIKMEQGQWITDNRWDTPSLSEMFAIISRANIHVEARRSEGNVREEQRRRESTILVIGRWSRMCERKCQVRD